MIQFQKQLRKLVHVLYTIHVICIVLKITGTYVEFPKKTKKETKKQKKIINP